MRSARTPTSDRPRAWPKGVQPGRLPDDFRYADGTRVRHPAGQGAYWVNIPPPPGVVIPRTYLGEMAILYVGDRWAVARVTNPTRLIEIGDEVELK